ncbi:hypothetical protein D9615_006758 [Tricholomella constricta]|uniref:Uncharacterized protein n=1 Tax=Tricholomella constricta TaxID=117010 RepID=A0A8H5H7Q2_9AGAR|nr:hypothetical protein D9615_006758 [Tricholomella constricta]
MSGTSSTKVSKVAKPVVTARKTANPANDTSNKENYAMAHRRETRDRRLTEKVAQQIRDEEVAAAKKASLAARRVARAKKVQYKLDKASGITQDVDNSDLEERHDTVFTSRTVPSKPAGVSGRSQAVVATATPAIKCHGKVPPPPSGRYEETNLESDGLSTDDNEDDDEPRGRPMRRRTGGGRHVSSSLSASSGDSPAAFDNSPPPSPLPLGSLSPTTASNKRNRKEDSDEDEDTLVFVKAQKITDNTGRPKASDYDDVGKEVILAAANIYRCLISTIDGFPDSAMEIKFVKMAWNRVNEDAQIIPMELTPSIGKIICI